MLPPIKHGIFKLNLNDHYAVLGIDLTADSKEIRIKYLKIAQKLHPDTCKIKSDTEKRYASEILSKLVNPAYEELSKEKTRNEYLLILSQLGQRFAEEKDRVKLISEPAQQLLKAGEDYELVYKNLLKKLTSEQYKSLEESPHAIAQLSELNLAYLIHQQSRGLSKNPQKLASAKNNVKTSSTETTSKPSSRKKAQTDEPTNTKQVASYIRRAQEYIEKNSFTSAIAELRDAIKLDPNNSSCHGLMGLVYLKQNQLSMAKVHINKAWQSNPQDPIAIQSKKELDKLEKTTSKNQNSSTTSRVNASSSSNKSGNSSMFGGLFGGKKK
jgi:curved DNA-binding protein CbpA